MIHACRWNALGGGSRKATLAITVEASRTMKSSTSIRAPATAGVQLGPGCARLVVRTGGATGYATVILSCGVVF